MEGSLFLKPCSPKDRRPRILPLLFAALSLAVGTRAGAAVVIEARIDGGPWVKTSAVYPLKGQRVTLRVEPVPGGQVRWHRIIPDTSGIYQNANHPWEKNPYRWVGLARIKYDRHEVEAFRGRWEMEPFDKLGRILSATVGPESGPDESGYHRRDAGSFWFQAEVRKEGRIELSPGLDDSDSRGLSPKVFRISVRDGEGYLGYLTSFFNVPGLFGSIPYQSNNYIGADCADVLMAAYGKWKNMTISDNYNVAMLVSRFPHRAEFDLSLGNPNKETRWGTQVRPGDIIAVRYSGKLHYQHIGALSADENGNGLLDGADLVLHAGPYPLHRSRLDEGAFDGHVLILSLP